MCTLVLLLRPGHDWPLVIAANRDEMLNRPADPPGAWWPGQPDVVGGRDRTAGGTWLAVRKDGMVASVLNRSDSLGPAQGFASRGELPLIALGFADAAAVGPGMAVRHVAYRGYNLIVADRESAWFVRGREGSPAEAIRLESGLHMVTARDPDDLESPRTARHLPRLRDAPQPPDWSGWHNIMADRSGPPGAQMNIEPISGFGTVSASRIAVPATGAPLFSFADGPPDRAAFVTVPTHTSPHEREWP